MHHLIKKTSRHGAPLLALALSLTGCAGSIPLTGRMERTSEIFTGSIEGSGNGGTGTVTLVSSGKSTCTGTFVNTSRHRGDGVLNCDDGRSGTFKITGTGATGNGSGELSGRRFTFTFQDPQQ